jgi:hypothetical protein
MNPVSHLDCDYNLAFVVFFLIFLFRQVPFDFIRGHCTQLYSLTSFHLHKQLSDFSSIPHVRSRKANKYSSNYRYAKASSRVYCVISSAQ